MGGGAAQRGAQQPFAFPSLFCAAACQREHGLLALLLNHPCLAPHMLAPPLVARAHLLGDVWVAHVRLRRLWVFLHVLQHLCRVEGWAHNRGESRRLEREGPAPACAQQGWEVLFMLLHDPPACLAAPVQGGHGTAVR